MKTDDVRAVADDLLAKIAIVKASIADIDKRCAEISLQALEDGDTEAQKGLAAFHKERAVRGASPHFSHDREERGCCAGRL